MAEKIKQRCIILCASPYCQRDFINKIVTENDFVICADGGLDTALQCGIQPDVLIGDFDSLKAKQYVQTKNYPTILLPKEKDDTDSISSIRYALRQGCKDFVLLGATGGRIDHTYANLHLLKFLYHNDCSAIIQDQYTDIYYTEKTLTLYEQGRTISILPYGCNTAEVSLSGFKYPAEHMIMHSDFPIGISNVALSEQCTVEVYTGGVLIIVNKP